MKCPECGQKMAVTRNTPCRACEGVGTVADGKGGKTACRRCNGSGLEIRNVARRNRARGNSTELKFARDMQKWWSSYDPGAEFQRTPSSGGSKLKDGWGLRGDVVTNSPDFPFFIECKKEKAWNMHDLLADSGGRIGAYLAQMYAEDEGRAIGLLRFSHPGPSQPTFVATVVFGDRPDLLEAVERARPRNAIGIDREFNIGGRAVPVRGYVMRLDAFVATDPKDWIVEVADGPAEGTGEHIHRGGDAAGRTSGVAG